jgi:non-lysosomal glucosylceramidase
MTTNPPDRPLIPEAAWSRTIGQDWEKPYTVRYASNLDDGPHHGMPLGGFGGGCIGRSANGDFNLWHLYGAEHTFKSIPACQFSVFEQPEGGQAKAYAMNTQPPEDGSLSRWQWYPQNQGTYHALYPRSWYRYEGVFEATLTCEQFSPIWADSYQESSYPLAIFEWTAHNPTDRPITMSIMVTWQNIIGWFNNAVNNPQISVRDDGSPVYEYQPRWGDSTGNLNQWIVDHHRVGCLFDRIRMDDDQIRPGEGQMCIASISNIALESFCHTRWHPQGDGGEVWDNFAYDGSLSDFEDETPADPGEQIAGAFAIRFTLRPGKTRVIPFVLAWDFPVLAFGEAEYFRRYTDFFGRRGKDTWTMVRTALKHHEMWKESILAWQQPILDRSNLPDWFKMALFNELYLLTQGGAVWTAADERDPIGQFGVLECLDYRWYESLDVRLYGGFGLLMLFPKLEKAVLEAFTRAIPTSDPTPRVIGYNNAPAVRKIAGATPHDLGAPNEHPWAKSNYTSYQDCNLWKDLPSDFVLQIHRYFLFTGSQDVGFLRDCWGTIVEALAYLKTFDLDGDGIPENSGAPDQTFDDWRLQGISAYCGGLWLAALESAIAIGQILLTQPDPSPELSETISLYQQWFAQSQPLYQAKLWNGQFYNLDTGSGSEVVMTDQLCGQFYARLLDLPDIVPPECTLSALKTIYDSCFLKFYAGKFGAANGVKLDGTPVDPEATHPLEVWTGINFGLAAFLIQMGMKAEAMQLTEAVVQQVYTNGLQFRTPEAITAAGTFRACHYLRAMAIWGILWQLDRNP